MSDLAAPSVSETPTTSQGPVGETAPVSAPEIPAAGPATLSDEPVAAPVTSAPEPTAPHSLLGDAEAPVAEEPAKTEPEAPAADAVALPTYEKFTLPEGITLDDGQVGNFSKLLGEFENTTKADHATVQALGQQLVDFYINEQKTTSERMQQLQQDNWQRMNDEWRDQVKADPDIGGNRINTTLRQATAVIERYGSVMGKGSEDALKNALRVTGAGNHPELIRFMNWAAKGLTEQSRPVAAIVPKSPQPQSRAQRRYGSNGVA